MDELENKKKLKETQKRKNNMRLFPYYIMFGNDLLFYYSIYVLFLSEVKQVSDANIVFLSSIYAISTVFVMLTITAIFCIFSAISTIASGYLYKIDPYIPMKKGKCVP